MTAMMGEGAPHFFSNRSQIFIDNLLCGLLDHKSMTLKPTLGMYAFGAHDICAFKNV
jgi:hypothetical protein